MQIDKICQFNELDPYIRFDKNKHTIKPYNFYIYRNKSVSLLGNQENAFSYGKFLPADAEILVFERAFFHQEN